MVFKNFPFRDQGSILISLKGLKNGRKQKRKNKRNREENPAGYFLSLKNDTEDYI